MIKNPKLRRPIGQTKSDDKPGMYNSPLFARQHPGKEKSQYAKSTEVPEEGLESLEPDEDDKLPGRDISKRVMSHPSGLRKPPTHDPWGEKLTPGEIAHEQKVGTFPSSKPSRPRKPVGAMGLPTGPMTPKEHRSALSRLASGKPASSPSRPASSAPKPRKPVGAMGLPTGPMTPKEHRSALARMASGSGKPTPAGRTAQKPPVAVAMKSATDLSETQKAMQLLDDFFKASSAGVDTKPTGGQRKREYDSSFSRFTGGESGGETPDLPERGRDWHGTVPGVPDEPQEVLESEKRTEKPPKNLLENKDHPPPKKESPTEKAIKALAGAPRYARGPMLPPRYKKFMMENGYTEGEINSGAQLTPRLLAEFNRTQVDQVFKSLSALEEFGE